MQMCYGDITFITVDVSMHCSSASSALFCSNTYLIMLLRDVTLTYLHAATICDICTLTKKRDLQLWSI